MHGLLKGGRISRRVMIPSSSLSSTAAAAAAPAGTVTTVPLPPVSHYAYSSSSSGIKVMRRHHRHQEEEEYHCMIPTNAQRYHRRFTTTAVKRTEKKEAATSSSPENDDGGGIRGGEHNNGKTKKEVQALLLRLRTDKKFANQFSGLLTPEDLQDIAVRNQEERKLEVIPLTSTQWRQLFIRTAVPFFGFGVCDNLIMISVGDVIDSHFGVTLGFSTMIAAGLGQAVSDGSGITIQGFIEASADRLGLPDPHLTEAQRNSKSIMFWMQVFRTVGIVLGCLMGLIPVFLFDTGNRPRLYDQMLKALPEEQRRALSTNATVCSFKEGEYILEFDKEPTGMYTILSGEVKVVGRNDYGDEVEFCTNGPGYGVGVVELVFQHHCVADVIAMTPNVKAMKVSKAAFDSYSGSNGELKKLVTEYVSKEDTFVPYRMRYIHTDEKGNMKFVNDGTLKHFAAMTASDNNRGIMPDEEEEGGVIRLEEVTNPVSA